MYRDYLTSELPSPSHFPISLFSSVLPCEPGSKTTAIDCSLQPGWMEFRCTRACVCPRPHVSFSFSFSIPIITTHNPQPTTHNPQPTTHNPQPTTHNPQPTTHNHEPPHPPPTPPFPPPKRRVSCLLAVRGVFLWRDLMDLRGLWELGELGEWELGEWELGE